MDTTSNEVYVIVSVRLQVAHCHVIFTELHTHFHPVTTVFQILGGKPFVDLIGRRLSLYVLNL